jgi:hypothetical protein
VFHDLRGRGCREESIQITHVYVILSLHILTYLNPKFVVHLQEAISLCCPGCWEHVKTYSASYGDATTETGSTLDSPNCLGNEAVYNTGTKGTQPPELALHTWFQCRWVLGLVERTPTSPKGEAKYMNSHTIWSADQPASHELCGLMRGYWRPARIIIICKNDLQFMFGTWRYSKTLLMWDYGLCRYCESSCTKEKERRRQKLGPLWIRRTWWFTVAAFRLHVRVGY